jgi:hypothetical protein
MEEIKVSSVEEAKKKQKNKFDEKGIHVAGRRLKFRREVQITRTKPKSKCP